MITTVPRSPQVTPPPGRVQTGASRWKKSASAVALGIVATLSAAVALHGFGNAAASDDQARTAPIERIDFTPEQRAELLRMTDTPEEAAQFQANLDKAFAGSARISNAPPPQSSDTATSVRAANYTGSSFTVPAFVQGWDRDHWWLTMSYADAATGGIVGAVGACSVYVPWWFCTSVGAVLNSWVRGYGSANNHGVWAAVYRTGYITGGRW